jgi:L,D-transpeptidase catalytic domain
VRALATVLAALATAHPGTAKDGGFLIVRPARIDGAVALHAVPNGPVELRLGGRTAFGSPLAFSVADVRGRWLGVRTEALPNGRLGWIDAGRARLRTSRTQVWLEADLSRRTLAVHEGGRVLRELTVAVGRPGSPTPAGRFAISDKLGNGPFGGRLGCCVLVLTGHQPRLPRGWAGGDRLAVHGGPAATLGRAVSAGCLHADEEDLRYLMRIVPVGAPVVIHP